MGRAGKGMRDGASPSPQRVTVEPWGSLRPFRESTGHNCLHSNIVVVWLLSRVWLFCDAMACSPPSSSVHGNSPDKNTGVGCHFLLQGILLTQGSNLSPISCLANWFFTIRLPGKSLRSNTEILFYLVTVLILNQQKQWRVKLLALSPESWSGLHPVLSVSLCFIAMHL